MKVYLLVILIFFLSLFLTTTTKAETISQNDVEQYIHSNVNPNLSYIVLNLIWKESRFDVNAKNGNHIGLTQVNPSFHDIPDPYDWKQNINYCAGYLATRINEYGSPEMALMMWNMGDEKGKNLYEQGVISSYAKSIMKYADQKVIREE